MIKEIIIRLLSEFGYHIHDWNNWITSPAAVYQWRICKTCNIRKEREI